MRHARGWTENWSEQRPFRYKTRDGLEITSATTSCPKATNRATSCRPSFISSAVARRCVPIASGSDSAFIEQATVVRVRGYAVVPNFRITPGSGNKVYGSLAPLAARCRKITKMHSNGLSSRDLPIPSEPASPGASYGGYASLQAMVKTPDLFKCAVAGLAVAIRLSNTCWTFSDYVSSRRRLTSKAIIGVQDLKSQLGTRHFTGQTMREDQGRGVPCMLVRDDIRVPSTRSIMDKAPQGCGQPGQGLRDQAEGHGFGRLENNIDPVQPRC